MYIWYKIEIGDDLSSIQKKINIMNQECVDRKPSSD